MTRCPAKAVPKPPYRGGPSWYSASENASDPCLLRRRRRGSQGGGVLKLARPATLSPSPRAALNTAARLAWLHTREPASPPGSGVEVMGATRALRKQSTWRSCADWSPLSPQGVDARGSESGTWTRGARMEGKETGGPEGASKEPQCWIRRARQP